MAKKCATDKMIIYHTASVDYGKGIEPNCYLLIEDDGTEDGGQLYATVRGSLGKDVAETIARAIGAKEMQLLGERIIE